MTSPKTCPACGAAIAADAPQGLCPACLLRAGLPSGTQPPQRERWTPPTAAELAGAFPQLEILELIGQGGMGAVYRARQPNLDRVVALKILPPDTDRDPGFAERFTREARALAKLNHPNIVAVHDFGTSGGYHYLVMEYVDGATLRQLLEAGRIAAREALAIVPAICDALQYAHDRGIVHRDIKPENILLDRRGAVKIADFGLAKLVDTGAGDLSLTGERDVMGTPHYMAPEQVERPLEVDHRADIYSLGVVFYQMLTGELPLGRFEAPSRRVQVDVRLDEVVLRALEKEPARRYPKASELKTEVETIATTSASAPVAAKPHAGPRRALVIALFLVMAAAIGTLIVSFLQAKNHAMAAEGRAAQRDQAIAEKRVTSEAGYQNAQDRKFGPGNTAQWTEPVNNLAVRLTPERSEWREGQTPRFVFEARTIAALPFPVWLQHRSTFTVDNELLHFHDRSDGPRVPIRPAKNIFVLRLDGWVDSSGRPRRLATGHHRIVYDAQFELPGAQTGFGVLAEAEIDVVGETPVTEPPPIVKLIPDHLTWRTDETPSFRVEMQSRSAPQSFELVVDLYRVFQPREANPSFDIARFFAPNQSEITLRLGDDWVDTAKQTPVLVPGRHQVALRARFSENTIAVDSATIEIVAAPGGGDPEFDALDSNRNVLEIQLRQARRQLGGAESRRAAGLMTTLAYVALETRVALLEAKLANDRVRFAEVKVKAAERVLVEMESRHATGVATDADLRTAEDTLAVEKLRLDAARQSAAAPAPKP